MASVSPQSDNSLANKCTISNKKQFECNPYLSQSIQASNECKKFIYPSSDNMNDQNLTDDEDKSYMDDLLSPTMSSSSLLSPSSLSSDCEHLQFHRIYIFDFDDTIFPTSILQKNLKIWNHTELNTINDYQQCLKLYQIIKNCIEYVINIKCVLQAKYGKNNVSFVIITNASKDWFDEIKQEHSSLIAELIIKMERVIPIISAKDEFEAKYDDWYSEYSITAKTDSFINYIKSLDLTDKIPIVYSVGDGKPEYNGSKLACEELWDYTNSTDSASTNSANSITNDDENEDQDENENEVDGVYILHRIQLKTNRKSKYHTFKSLDLFWDILQKTQQFLFHSDKEMIEILEKEEEDDSDNHHDIGDDNDGNHKLNYDDDEEDDYYNIIDYKL